MLEATACYYPCGPHTMPRGRRGSFEVGGTGSAKHVTSGYIRIETANTNVPLMHRAAWIRNRRQASRRVATRRRDEAPAQKFPWISDVWVTYMCVCVPSPRHRDLSRMCAHCADRALRDLHSRAVTRRALCFQEMRADYYLGSSLTRNI